MRELAGKVAVVTGAASGLGRAMALAFAEQRMAVALADVDQVSLRQAADAVEGKGGKAFSMKVDVSKGEEVEAFADETERRLGPAWLVCNNAGVAPVGTAWEMSVDEWQWILGVNLWGVIHGVRTFTPRLLARDAGHVVNTASVSGLISPPGSDAYNVSKHGVVALTESLHHDLRERNSAVGVSLLCPAYVPTGIADPERVRPAHVRAAPKSKETAAKEAMLKKAVISGRRSAEDIAVEVVAAVKENRFYILTHPRIKGAIRARMKDILEERAPRDPLRL